MKLKKEAIKELMQLLKEVNNVITLLEEFGINITSDPWLATSFCDKENILFWKEEDFYQLNNINSGYKFYIGGNITTGAEHEYKNKWIKAPKELAKIQAKTFKEYLISITSINLRYFELEIEDRGLVDNCGWEHYLGINAIVKLSALEKNTIPLIEKIMKEEDNIIELSGSPLYKNPKNNFNKESQLVPKGNFQFMIEFFSRELIDDEDYIYQGAYGLNNDYIRDAMTLINKIESKAKEIEKKYSNEKIKVTINGLNDGCEKGMAIYVWIPYQLNFRR